MQLDEENYGEDYTPDKYKCPKCGTEMHYQPNIGWFESPVTLNDNPMCPVCWNEFLQGLGFEMKKVEE